MTLGRVSGASRIVLVGGGGHALVVASTAVQAGMAVAGFFDDDRGAVLGLRTEIPWLGGLDAVGAGAGLIVAVGDLRRRRELVARIGPVEAVSVCAPGS